MEKLYDKFFSKRKNEININEMDVSEKKTEHILEESKTLGDLAKSGHLFLDFHNLSQVEVLKMYMQNIYLEK